MNGTQLMEKVAEVAPETYDFIMQTRGEISESPWKDEFLEEFDGILKKAAMDWKSIGSSVGQGGLAMAKGLGATALGGIGLALAGDAYDATRRAITKTRNYKRMMASNPDLKDKPAHQVQAIFSTLHRFNPDFSGDPVVSGSFVRQHVDMAQSEEGVGAVGLDAMKAIVEGRKGINESRRLPKPEMLRMPDREMEMLQKSKLRHDLGAKK